jgi:SCY1-like protein 1
MMLRRRSSSSKAISPYLSRAITGANNLTSELEEVSDDFPEEFFRMKVLPELLKSIEFGGGGPRVLGLVVKIGEKLSDDEYVAKLQPVIIRLFSSPDRALRACLLDNLPRMIDHLTQKAVSDQIFPQLVRLLIKLWFLIIKTS